MGNTYVLMTSARNEEAYIEKTIKSVISQTVLPKKWIIVSDGSTDSTDEIVSKYANKYNFIQLIHIDGDPQRNFGSKVKALNAALKQLNSLEYYFIGNLDADVSFDPDYYEIMLEKFRENPKLGLAGGEIYEYDGEFVQSTVDTWHVSGAVQLFRRRCWEDIGGYLQLKRSVDAIAVKMVRMTGWEVEKYPNIEVFHYRRRGTGKGNILISRFKYGISEYTIGTPPIYMVIKFFDRLREKPYIIGSIFRLSGYCFSFLKREQRVLPNEVVKYIRHEQMQRLKGKIIKLPRNVFRYFFQQK